MGFVFLLNLLARPLITLVYPLYASIRAIESDSHAENQKWLTYWVLCGLIMLFELTAAKFIEWLPFWPHIKLMVALWLVVPHSNGAVYVYDHFVRPCFSVNPKAIGHLLRSSKQDQFRIGNSDDFLLVAERYVQEKGSEALEKLIFGKIKCVEPNPMAENNSVASMNNKEDALEAIKFDSTPAQIDYKGIAGTENKATIMVEVVGGGSVLPQSSVSDEVQKVWTCALCQVSAHCEAVLHNHLQGKKHMAEEKKLLDSILAQTDSKEIAPTEIKQTAGAEVVSGGCERPELSIISNVQKEWTCALCQVCAPSEDILRNHLQGKKHKAKEKELMEKQNETKNKSPSASTSNPNTPKVTPMEGTSANIPDFKYLKKTEEKKENSDKPGISACTPDIIYVKKPEEKKEHTDKPKMTPTGGVSRCIPDVKYIKKPEEKMRSTSKVTSKEGVSACVPAVKHIKKPEDKRENADKLKVKPKEGVLGINFKKPEERRKKTDNPKLTQKEDALGINFKKPKEKRVGAGTAGQWAETHQRDTKLENKSSALWCDTCQLQCNSSSMLTDHLSGKKHLASLWCDACQLQCNSSSMLTDHLSGKRHLASLWCDTCQLQCNSSSMLTDHLRGKRHLASAQGVYGATI